MIYQTWTFEAEQETLATVLPDGCRDVLLVSKAGASAVACFTDWDIGPRTVHIPAGTRIEGYRLRPGVTVPWRKIRSVVGQMDDPTSVIAEEAHGDEETSKAIDLLACPGASVQTVAAQLGVSERTLQRRLSAQHLPAPDFWRLLGRARQAVQSLSSDTSLAETALDGGYSDQAHMTREFARWFGTSPRQLKRSATAQVDLLQPGLGNWMGEHSSIK